MKIIIRSEPVDEKISVIALSVDRNKWNYLKMFHCPTDRTPLFQYSGEIMSISPTGLWDGMMVVTQCPTCKHKYMITRPSESV